MVTCIHLHLCYSFLRGPTAIFWDPDTAYFLFRYTHYEIDAQQIRLHASNNKDNILLIEQYRFCTPRRQVFEYLYLFYRTVSD